MRNTILFLAFLLCACPGPTENPQDLAAPDLTTPAGDLAFKSCCGKPGDTGNAMGIGKYCMTGADCMGGQLCSSAGNFLMPNRPTFFCTVLCSKNTDMGNPCGDGAQCECDSGGAGCACTPSMCVNNPPPGCTN